MKSPDNIPMPFLEAQSGSEGGIALCLSTPSPVPCLNQLLKPLDSGSGVISYKSDLQN